MQKMITFVISAFTLLTTLAECVIEAAANGSPSNGRFKIYQIRTSTVEQLSELFQMEQFGIVDVWRKPLQINSTADVMVDRLEHGLAFEQFVRKFNVEAKVLVDDLSKYIAEKETFVWKKTNRLKDEGDDLETPQLRDDPLSGTSRRSFGLQMGQHHNYPQIQEFMRRIISEMPAQAQLRTIGMTAEGRAIEGIQFGNPADRTKNVVWIDAGIHAREWTSIHTAVYFIQYVATSMNSDARLAHALRSVDILIFPCLNPDGYEYTRQDPQNVLFRMWRKNRSPEKCAREQTGETRCCKGVDLNRNFDFKFAAAGSSNYSCSEIYHGEGPFSELETRAVRDAVQSSDLQGRIGAFISMHAYSQLFIYPYANKAYTYPPDVEDLRIVARRAITAIGQKFGTVYQSGTGPEIIYPYAGGSSDWAKETARIKYTYTIELRPAYWSWNGFILAQNLLTPTARETWDGVMVVIEATAEMASRSKANQGKVISSRIMNARSLLSFNSRPAKNRKVMTVSGEGECEDKLEYCKEWVSRNADLCKSARKTMEKECRKTCSIC